MAIAMAADVWPVAGRLGFFPRDLIYLTLAGAGLRKSRVVRGCGISSPVDAPHPRVPAGAL
jgi:hypothetical protein